jgi:osmoprotectant transport system substrate-binding protein/osmoprotectant transport system permease protein
MNLAGYFAQHAGEILQATGEHVWLTGITMLLAVAIGVPLGIVVARRPRLSKPILGGANIAETIPSLALFGFLLPLPWLGARGDRIAIAALTLYALLPIIRNTAAGIRSVDPAVREAARGMGMTEGQMLWRVEMPLAFPTILAGIRVATVWTIGIATIAAAVGAGGLGEYIFRGLAMVNNDVILAGAIPAALLALFADLLLGLLERRMRPERRKMRPRRASWPGAGVGAKAVAILVALVATTLLASCGGTDANTIVVGSKNFPEQALLGEILAQEIEARTHLHVVRKFYLAGTFICQQALLAGRIDTYVEYTGTALTAILKDPIEQDPSAVFAKVQRQYQQRFKLAVLPSLGFNNTFAIVIRGADARRLHLKTISEAATFTPHWRAGFGYEFMGRPDGYAGLVRTYGLKFAGPPKILDLGLLYRALLDREVDLVAGNSTDGLLSARDLTVLQDDKHFFPPYQAVPVVRDQALARHPEVRAAMDALAGKISDAQMQKMNYEVVAEHRDISQVAREFLRSSGLG